MLPAFDATDGATPASAEDLEGRLLGRVAAVLGHRHKRSILLELGSGARRYKELERALAPITPKVLCAHLRELIDLEFVVRHDYSARVLRVEYALTDLGQRFEPIFASVRDWTAELARMRREA